MTRYFLPLFFSLMTPFSTNAQWVQLDSRSNSSLNSIYFIDNKTGFIAASLNSGSTGSKPINGQILMTSDGGATWTSRFNGDSVTYIKSTQFFGTTTGVAVGFKTYPNDSSRYDGVIVVSNDSGKSWQSKHSPLLENIALISVSTFLDTNLVAVGTKTENLLYQGILLKSSDKGNTWIDATPPIADLASIYKIMYTSPSSAYFEGLEISGDDVVRVLYHSHDGLQTWEKISLPFGKNGQLTTFDFLLDNIGIVSGIVDNKPVMYRTVNAGVSWTEIEFNPPSSSLILNMKYMNRTHILAIGEDATGNSIVFKSSDEGFSWTQEHSPAFSQSRFIEIGYAYLPQMLFADYAYLIGENGVVLRSNITGNPSAAAVSIEGDVLEFHSQVNSSSAPKSVKIQFDNIEQETVILMPEYFEVSLERNGQFSRTLQLSKEFSSGVKEIFIRYSPATQGKHNEEMSIRYFAARIFKLTLTGQTDVTSVEEGNKSENDFSIVPNPAQNTIHLSFEESSLSTEIRIFNIFGQQIAGSQIPAGIKERNIDLTGLPPGTYIIKRGNRSKVITKY